MTRLENLWDVVRSIPPGRVASYGDVGRALDSPVSGVLVGKWMAQCPPDVPWWRVVGRDGGFPIGKAEPARAARQAQRLGEEGVELEHGVVPADRFWLP